MKKRLLKYTILSFAVLFSVANAIMPPMIGSIGREFVDVDPLVLKQLITITFVPQIVVGLLIGILVRGKVRMNSLLIVGLIIYLCGGAMGYMSDTIITLLISRFIVGISIGTLATIGPGLITMLYKGEKKDKMMGYNIAFMNAGSVVAAVVAGFLATNNWRAPFLLYGLAIISLVLVIFVFEEPVKIESNAKSNFRMNKKIYIMFLYSIVIAVLMGAISTNLALYLDYKQMGGAAFAGTIMASAGITSFLVAMYLVRIMHILKERLILVAIAICTLGFTVIAGVNNGILVLLGACMVYGAISMLIPIILSKGTDAVESDLKTFAISIINTGFSVGMVLSPFIFALFEKVFSNKEPVFIYQCSAVICVASMLLYMGVSAMRQVGISKLEEVRE